MRNYNARKHASLFNVAKGQHVQVRDKIRSDKYEPIWTQPRRVTEQINDSTVSLDNWTVCNAADLIPASPPLPELQPPPNQPPKAEKQFHVQAPAVEQPELRRSNREGRPPAWHADYSIPKPNNKNWFLHLLSLISTTIHF